MTKPDLSALNDLLSSKYRLAIMRLLSTGDEYEFTALKNELQLTDGNLSSHMAKLEAGGLISVHKRFTGKKPRTAYLITRSGLDAYRDYLSFLSYILKDGTLHE